MFSVMLAKQNDHTVMRCSVAHRSFPDQYSK